MPELAFATKINASRGKPAKMKLLAFAFFYFLESRLFKGLLPIQIIKKSAAFLAAGRSRKTRFHFGEWEYL
jgi:hypothetical protein